MKNTYTDFERYLQNGKKMIVFGCGKRFQKFVCEHPQMVNYIEMILDNTYQKENLLVDGKEIPVCIPEKVLEYDTDKYVFLFCAVAWSEMKEQLDNLIGKEYLYFRYPLSIDYMNNYEKAYQVRVVNKVIEKLNEYKLTNRAADLLKKSSEELIAGLKDKQICAMARMPIVLTPKCTLRCKDCNNLMWRFEQPEELDVIKIKKSIDNILSAVDFAVIFELIGGEPFVAKNFKEVLSFLLTKEKLLKVEITTNGTVKLSKDVKELLKNEKVTVRISNYGNVVNQQPFIEELKKNQISYNVLPMDRWTEVGGINKRNRSAEELRLQYYSCQSGFDCKTLWEDKIYPCARAASLAVLGIYKECPYIDVSSEEGLWKKIEKFYEVPVCGACDYCDMAIDEVKYVEPAIQLQRKDKEEK